MSLTNILLWLVPFLLIAAAFFSFRLKTFRGLRYKIYGVILFVAFLSDLTGFSFRADQFDTVIKMLVLFVISEACWNLLRIKNRNAAKVLIFCCIAVFGLVYSSWIFQGPKNAERLWKAETVDRYKNDQAEYVVKERRLLKGIKKVRVFELYKNINSLPLESKIRTWEAAEGYYRADFNYRWSYSYSGVRLDLISGKDTLWTLGEQFK